MATKQQKLIRAWYRTDAHPSMLTEEDEAMGYVGVFSAPFPAETPDRRIVAVHWIGNPKAAEVEVTWLVYA